MDELVERVSAALAAEYSGAPNGRVRDLPDRRAIRWYTTTGLVDRPLGMRGRTALYGRRHLLQLVAVKRRQAQGHTLAAIQAELHGASDAVLAEVARVLRPGGTFAFSVTHPLRWAMPDDAGPGGLAITQSYWDRTPYVEEDEDGTPRYVEHHRTLGDRVRDVVAAGLVLEDLVEPEWPPGHERIWGQWSPLRGRVYGSTAIYVSELHPTHLRATAVGWFFGIGRIGSFLAPTVIGFMLAYGAGAYVLHTFALSFLVAAFALWAIGIETRGKVLEEITAPKTA